MDEKKLLSIIAKGEGIKVDFKRELHLEYEGAKKELAKDVCAIANSRGGRGYIIVGVEDKTREIVGVKDLTTLSEEKIQQIVSSRCEPPIPIMVEIMDIKDKKVGIIVIYDGGQKPYQIRETGAFNIRRGSTTDTMRKEELVAAFGENLNLTVEICPIMKSTIEFLNMEIVSKYFESKGIYINKDNEKYLLESAGIIYFDTSNKVYRCTLGGLLVFSDINSICIPQNMIKIVDKSNDSKDNVIMIEGNLLDIIHKAEKNLRTLLKADYPIEAVMEAVKNAVLYREYSIFNKIIEIVITKKSIIILSPGQMIIKNNKGKNKKYNGRNMWIYEKLLSLDKNNTFTNDGFGINRMKNAFNEKGKVQLINSVYEDCFKVILPYYQDK